MSLDNVELVVCPCGFWLMTTPTLLLVLAMYVLPVTYYTALITAAATEALQYGVLF